MVLANKSGDIEQKWQSPPSEEVKVDGLVQQMGLSLGGVLFMWCENKHQLYVNVTNDMCA